MMFMLLDRSKQKFGFDCQSSFLMVSDQLETT